jgi:hypothetical protein
VLPARRRGRKNRVVTRMSVQVGPAGKPPEDESQWFESTRRIPLDRTRTVTYGAGFSLSRRLRSKSMSSMRSPGPSAGRIPRGVSLRLAATEQGAEPIPLERRGTRPPLSSGLADPERAGIAMVCESPAAVATQSESVPTRWKLSSCPPAAPTAAAGCRLQPRSSSRQGHQPRQGPAEGRRRRADEGPQPVAGRQDRQAQGHGAGEGRRRAAARGQQGRAAQVA